MRAKHQRSDNYGYDANDNVTNHAGNTGTYDAENRLASYSVGGTTVNFTYDADGALVKRVAGQTTVYPSTGLRTGVTQR